MKFGHLIENNMINIFLEKSYAKCGVEASPRPFHCMSKSMTTKRYKAFLKNKERSGTNLRVSFSP